LLALPAAGVILDAAIAATAGVTLGLIALAVIDEESRPKDKPNEDTDVKCPVTCWVVRYHVGGAGDMCVLQCSNGRTFIYTCDPHKHPIGSPWPVGPKGKPLDL
jgi:hypothetical protein